MRFYKNQHQFYIGIDLHARSMYVCVVNNSGETVFHKNMACSRENLELVTDYMCLIQDAFPGIFFWIAIQALLFYCATETIILLKVNRLEKKRWLGVIFFYKPIDRLGPYMCYVLIFFINFIFCSWPKPNMQFFCQKSTKNKNFYFSITSNII